MPPRGRAFIGATPLHSAPDAAQASATVSPSPPDGAMTDPCLPLPQPVLEHVLHVLLGEGGESEHRDVANAARACRALRDAARRVLDRACVWVVEVDKIVYDWSPHANLRLAPGRPAGHHQYTTSRVHAVCASLAVARAHSARAFADEFDRDVDGDKFCRVNQGGWPDATYLARSPPYTTADFPSEEWLAYDLSSGEDVDTRLERSLWWQGPHGRDGTRVRVRARVVLEG